MHGPEDPDLVAGAVEPVVAAVHGHGGQDPGEGGVPGEVHQAVLGVDLDIQCHHEALGQQTSGGHEEAGGDAGHTVRQIVPLTQPEVHSSLEAGLGQRFWFKNLNLKRFLFEFEPLSQPFLQENHGDHEGHRLLNIVGYSLQFLEGMCCRINDVEELAIPLQYLGEAQGVVCHDVRLAVYSSLILLLLTSSEC